MFGIGMPELIIILVVALIVVGPKKLPDLAKSLGKGMSEFRKATDEIKSELSQNETYNDFKEVTSTVKNAVDDIRPDKILDVDAITNPMKAIKEDIAKVEESVKAEVKSEAKPEAPSAGDVPPAPKEASKSDA